MRGNLILEGLDWLVAMDRQHNHQHIGSGFVLVLPWSGLLGKKYSFWACRYKSYSNWAGQEAPRISSYATCISPFFEMIEKRSEPLQLFFVPPVDVQTCCSKCCFCFVEQRGSQRALNVSMCQLRSPFTCNLYFFLSALTIKQCTSCGCTKITCATLLHSWNNCPELCCTTWCGKLYKFRLIVT